MVLTPQIRSGQEHGAELSYFSSRLLNLDVSWHYENSGSDFESRVPADFWSTGEEVDFGAFD